MKALDLFSGIGGFSLGMELCGIETVQFCEISLYCQRILRKHWPGIPIHEDIRSLNYDGEIDIITGGFPCQDISLANSGKMAGIAGKKSGLWSEFYKQIQRHNPAFIVIENSPVLRSKGLDSILSSLAQIGYDAEWHCIPATAVDAPHSRDRLWVIAYPSGYGDRLPEGQILTRRHFIKYASAWQAEPRICRVVDGLPNQSHQLGALGNAVLPQIVYVICSAILESISIHKKELTK